MDLHAAEWGNMDSIDLAQERFRWQELLNVVMKHMVPQNVVNFLNFLIFFTAHIHVAWLVLSPNIMLYALTLLLTK